MRVYISIWIVSCFHTKRKSKRKHKFFVINQVKVGIKVGRMFSIKQFSFPSIQNTEVIVYVTRRLNRRINDNYFDQTRSSHSLELHLPFQTHFYNYDSISICSIAKQKAFESEREN